MIEERANKSMRIVLKLYLLYQMEKQNLNKIQESEYYSNLKVSTEEKINHYNEMIQRLMEIIVSKLSFLILFQKIKYIQSDNWK